MSDNQERVRCILIGACTAAASRAMDAAAIEVSRGTLGGPESEVEIFAGTRGGLKISARERDRRAEVLISEVRQRLDVLSGLYPCDLTDGRPPAGFDAAVEEGQK